MPVTYAEITSNIQNELATTETSFVAAIPTFVKAAEEYLARTFFFSSLRTTTTIATTASNRFIAKPSDYVAAFSLDVDDGTGSRTHLLPKQEDFIRAAYPSVSTEGLPRFYANYDETQFLLGPTPDAIYTTSLTYLKIPTSIVDDATTWLGDKHGNALYWSTVVFGYTYLKGNPEKMAEYTARRDEATDGLTKISEMREKRDSYRSGEPRIEV